MRGLVCVLGVVLLVGCTASPRPPGEHDVSVAPSATRTAAESSPALAPTQGAASAAPDPFAGAPWPSSNTLCSLTQVRTVGPRLLDPSKLSSSAQARLEAGKPLTQTEVDQAADRVGGGAAIDFTNGIGLTDYSTNAIASHERPGDEVQLCLISVPSETDCPNVGRDQRGRIYRVYDYKAKAVYRMQNSEHGCGGA